MISFKRVLFGVNIHKNFINFCSANVDKQLMSRVQDRMNDAEWEEFVQLNQRASLMSFGLVVLVLAFHKGFVAEWPSFSKMMAALGVIYFGGFRYVLARVLRGPKRHKTALAYSFRLVIVAQAIAWGVFVSVFSNWNSNNATETILAVLLLAGIPAAASTSLSLKPRLQMAFVLSFFATSLGYFHYVGGHELFPYLSPIAAVYSYFIYSLSKGHVLTKKQLLEARDQVFQKNDNLEILLEESKSLILLTDSKGKILFSNKYFRKVFGEKPENNSHWKDVEAFVESSHMSKELEYTFSQSEEKFWTFQKKLPSEEKVIFIWTDLSELTKIQKLEELDQLKGIEAKKLQILSEFSKHISDEINRPLAKIWVLVCRLQALPSDKLAEQSTQLRLTKIASASSKLVEIAKALKLLSDLSTTKEAVKTESFLLGDVLDNVVASVWSQIHDAGISFEVQCDLSETWVSGSSIWCKQIILNLIVNAYDAIQYNDDAKIELEVYYSSAGIEFWVKDSGEGLDENMQQKVFEPFYSSKPPGEGMGLGLSLSRELAHRLGGDLNYKPDPAGHTGFVLCLPSLADKISEAA